MTATTRDAQARLDELVTEQDEIPGRIRQAVETGDGETVTRLRRRLDEIPDELSVARAMVLQAQIQQLQAREAELRPVVNELASEREKARKALDEATKVFNEVNARYVNQANELRGIPTRRGQLQTRLDNELATSVSNGPVVRASWLNRG
jgi:chromosome segregation ATPase